MWVFQNNSFVSVVAHRGRPGMLLVRSRIKGDIERALPDAKVWEDPSADYRYRAIVSKKRMRIAMAKAVDRIDYPNFKNGVTEPDRHDAYMGVWGVMARFFGAFGLDRRQRADQAALDLDAGYDPFLDEVEPTSGDEDIDAYLYGDDVRRVFPGWDKRTR